jgi:hypothetical protein
MLLEAETNKYCPGGYDIGAISNLITWVLNFFLSVFHRYDLTTGLLPEPAHLFTVSFSSVRRAVQYLSKINHGQNLSLLSLSL